jgi:hypothetical protein
MKPTEANTRDSEPRCGSAALDQELLESLTTLWSGGMTPQTLPAIEVALRAFLAHERLHFIPTVNPDHLEPDDEFREFAERMANPFHHDPLANMLEYEFEPTDRELQEFEPVNTELMTKLRDDVWNRYRSETPQWLANGRQYRVFMKAWFADENLTREEIIHEAVSDPSLLGDGWNPEAPHDYQFDRECLERAIDGTISGLIALHERRCSVYGHGRMISHFDQYLQSEWPEYLFKRFGEQFKEEAELLRAPGDPLPLPPFTLLVLSRASRRETIPETIRDLREEFAEDRAELWGQIRALVGAETRKQQREALRDLIAASGQLFAASGGLTTDSSRRAGMSLLIEAGTLNARGVLKSLADRDEPLATVSRVGFTRRLAKLMKHVQSEAKVLRRHLDPEERRIFGMAR